MRLIPIQMLLMRLAANDNRHTLQVHPLFHPTLTDELDL